MPQVFEIRSDDTAVISTVGLFRVVIRIGTELGEVIGELLTEHEALAVANTFNECRAKRDKKLGVRADVMDYRSAAPHCCVGFARNAEPDAYKNYAGKTVARTM